MDKYDCLKIENQMCFPLYALSKEIIRMYKPFLDELDLTYTQYITMMVIWEKQKINVKELGSLLYLDSGTLTPLLKKLEQKSYITRERNKEDERNLIIQVTSEGMMLREKALSVPSSIQKCISIDLENAKAFYETIHTLLNQISSKNKQ